jgi:hypothetical protein
VCLWHGLKQREWLWLGVLIYSAAVVLTRGLPTGRYLAPLAPALLLGVWHGIAQFGPPGAARWRRRLCQGAVWVLVASILACNVAIFGVNLWAARSPRFASEWLAGEYGELARIGRFLEGERSADESMAVFVWYGERTRRGGGIFAYRAAVFLAPGRSVYGPPRAMRRRGNAGLLSEWLRTHDVRYVLSRPPLTPHRLWHFRRPSADGRGVPAESDFFVLYDMGRGIPAEVDLPAVGTGVARVPGL